MGSLRGFLGRHAGVLLAALISPAFVELQPVTVARPRVVLPEHEARVVAFSPDGRLLVTDGASGGCIRDAATGRVLVRLLRDGAGGPTPATQITWPRFTPDGRNVIVQLGGRRFGPELTVTLAVFDTATGRERAEFAGVGSGIWHGSALPPAEYALSADGSTLAFCRVTGFGPQRRGRVTVWDIDAAEVATEFSGLPPLALSPDGAALAHHADGADPSRPASPTIRVLKPGRPAKVRVDDAAALTGLGAGPIAFSPDGKLLAARDPEDDPQTVEVKVFDASRGAVRAVLNPNLPHRNDWFSPGSLWFSPDARTLILEDLGGYSNVPRIQCWDLSGTAPRKGLQGPSESFTPDGSRAAVVDDWDGGLRWMAATVGNRTVEVFDLPAEQARLRLVATEVHKATISPDGRMLALPSDRKVAVERDALSAFLKKIRLALGLGTLSDTLEDFNGLPTVDVHDIALHDAATGEPVGTIVRAPRPYSPESTTFSPDGKTLVVRYPPEGSRGPNSENPMIDWAVELWDVPRGREVRGLRSRLAALAAAALVLVGGWIDRRRALRALPADAPPSGPDGGGGPGEPRG